MKKHNISNLLNKATPHVEKKHLIVVNWSTYIVTILALISTGLSFYFSITEKHKKNDTGISARIIELDNIQQSLKDFDEFIVNQRNAIIQAEQNIKELEKQRTDLEPIIASQKETVEAIFREQENRNKKHKWIDRLLGFGIGLLASLAASWIVKLLTKNRG